MSPSPRRKVTGARPTAIGSKATTPSQASRDRARTSSGNISHSRSVRPQAPAERWAAAVDGALERLTATLAEMHADEPETDSERPAAPGTPPEGVSSLHGEITRQESLSQDDGEADR